MSFFPLHAQNNWFCKPYADKSVPANNSTPSKVLDRKTKTFDGVELFAGTDLSAQGSQNQLFCALQWGK